MYRCKKRREVKGRIIGKRRKVLYKRKVEEGKSKSRKDIKDFILTSISYV